MSRRVREVFVPVPQEYMGRIIGTRGSNVKQIAQETRTRIKTCNRENVGEGPGFLVIGTPRDCKDAQRAIQSCIVCIQNLLPFFLVSSDAALLTENLCKR